MTRLAALACLLFLLLPTAAQAAGRAGTARALAAQMANAGPSSGAFAVDLDTGRTIYKQARGHAADARLGGEALHLGGRCWTGSAPPAG